MSDEANSKEHSVTPAPASIQEQPVAQQAPAQPGQSVQYIMTQKSLNGVGGWLIGWLIYMALVAFGCIVYFFAILQIKSDATANAVAESIFDSAGVLNTTLIFMPLIALAAIGAIVFIAQRKALGKMFSLAQIGLFVLWVLLITFIGGGDAVGVASSVCITLLVGGLQTLYFYQSDRVKQTLVQQ